MLDSCSLIGRKPGRSSGMVAQHSRITWVHRIRIDKVNRKGCPNIEIYKILLALGRTSYTLTGQLPGWERIWPRCTLSTTSGFFALFCKRYWWLFIVGQAQSAPWSMTKETTHDLLFYLPYGISPQVNTSQQSTPYAQTSLLDENRVKFKTWIESHETTVPKIWVEDKQLPQEGSIW